MATVHGILNSDIAQERKIYSLLYCIIAKLAICSEFVSVCYNPELPVPYLNVGNEGNLLSLRQ